MSADAGACWVTWRVALSLACVDTTRLLMAGRLMSADAAADEMAVATAAGACWATRRAACVAAARLMTAVQEHIAWSSMFELSGVMLGR